MPISDFKKREPLGFTTEDVGEYLIRIITGGLYEKPHLIIREYIQNSYDEIYSWDEAPEIGRINIKINRPNIHIIDNGPGMSREEIRDSMSNVGISSKPYGELSGFMGIGKFAGLSMADKVRISSSKHGISQKNWVEFDGQEMVVSIEGRRSRGEAKPITETLEEYTTYNTNPIPSDKSSHFTSVHLMGISETYWDKIEDDEFMTRLGHVAPVNQDPDFKHCKDVEDILRDIQPEEYYPIQVRVDGERLYRPYTNSVSSPRQIEVVDENGSQMAYGWVCLHEESEQIENDLLRGIALFDHGISIGDRQLPEDLGLYSGTSDIIYFRWYMGELYLVDEDIRLKADRRGLRQNDQTSEFVEHATTEFQKLVRRASKFSRRDNAEKKAPKAIEQIDSIDQKLEAGNISKERVPHTIQKLSSARQDLKDNRVRYLEGELEERARAAMEKADDLIKSLTESPEQETNTGREEDTIQGGDHDGKSQQEKHSKGTAGTADVDAEARDQRIKSTESESGEAREIPSLPNRLEFSDEETTLFNAILEGISDATGGRGTDRFAQMYDSIKQQLIYKYE